MDMRGNGLNLFEVHILEFDLRDYVRVGTERDSNRIKRKHGAACYERDRCGPRPRIVQ